LTNPINKRKSLERLLLNDHKNNTATQKNLARSLENVGSALQSMRSLLSGLSAFSETITALPNDDKKSSSVKTATSQFNTIVSSAATALNAVVIAVDFSSTYPPIALSLENRALLKGPCCMVVKFLDKIFTYNVLRKGGVYLERSLKGFICEFLIDLEYQNQEVATFAAALDPSKDSSALQAVFVQYLGNSLKEKIANQGIRIPDEPSDISLRLEARNKIIEELYMLVRLLATNCPDLLNVRVSSILANGFEKTAPTLLEILTQLTLIPFQGPDLPIDIAASNLFFTRFCEQRTIQKAAASTFARIWDCLRQSSPIGNAVWEEFLQSEEWSLEDQAQIELFRRLSKIMETGLLGNLQLSTLSAPVDIVVLPVFDFHQSTENYFTLLTNLMESTRFELDLLLKNCHAGHQQQLDLAFITAQRNVHGKKGKNRGMLNRNKFEKEFNISSPALSQVKSLKKKIDSALKKCSTRYAQIKRSFDQWKRRPERNRLVLMELGQSFNWLSGSFSHLCEQIGEIHQMGAMSLKHFSIEPDRKSDDVHAVPTIESGQRAILSASLEHIQTVHLSLGSFKRFCIEISARTEALVKTLPVEAACDFPDDFNIVSLEANEQQEEESFETVDFPEYDEKDDGLTLTSATIHPPETLPALTTPSTVSEWVLQVMPELTSNLNLHSAPRAEVISHLFLAAQGVELFSTLYAEKRYNLLSLCFHSYLLDLHVSLEQSMRKNTVHSLQRQAKESGLDLSPMQVDFLRDHDKALLWARYPNYYREVYRHGSRPAGFDALIFLIDIDHNPGLLEIEENRQKLKQAALQTVDSFQQLISWFGKEVPKEFVKDLQDKISPPESMVLPLHHETIYSRLSLELQTASVHHQEAAIPLREASQYLRWMDQAKIIDKHMAHPQFAFWCTRIDLHIDKLFKHVFTAKCLIDEYGFVQNHTLSFYREILDIHTDKDHLMDAINSGIGHHYLHVKSSPLGSEMRALLKRSKLAAGVPDGFHLAHKSSDKGGVLHGTVRDALALFETTWKLIKP